MQFRHLLLLASGAVCAHAGVTNSPETSVTSAPLESGWDVTLGIYSPMMGLEGEVGLAGRRAPIDIPFEDVLEDFDAGFMAALELRNGPWSVTGDFIWLKLSDSADLAPGASVDFKQEEILASLALGYEVYSNENTLIDVLAGGALTNQEAELSFNFSGNRIDASGSQTWVDPFVGVRMRHMISDRWGVFARFDYGGFGVSSDEYWQAIAGINFRINDWASLALAYRTISVDYEQGGFSYDTESSGPNLGVIFRF
jgi:hypothetical protein